MTVLQAYSLFDTLFTRTHGKCKKESSNAFCMFCTFRYTYKLEALQSVDFVAIRTERFFLQLFHGFAIMKIMHECYNKLVLLRYAGCRANLWYCRSIFMNIETSPPHCTPGEAEHRFNNHKPYPNRKQLPTSLFRKPNRCATETHSGFHHAGIVVAIPNHTYWYDWKIL